jgi:AcrR family transcriptional regulator
MKKQPEVTAQTRANLIDAFWRLYCKKKLEHITVKEITDKAGYNRGTFYEYFTDIYDVLEQLEAALLEEMRRTVVESLKLGQGGDLTQRVADLYDSKGSYLSVLLGENGDAQYANRIKIVMRPALIEAFRLSETEVHTAYIFEFALSALIATITHWYKSGKTLSSQELISLVRSMLMSGVLPTVRKYSAM